VADLAELLAQIAKLSPAEREHLRRALGEARPTELPLFQFTRPAPHSDAWVAAERGHAVLETGAAEEDEALPEGPDALAGLWAERSDLR